MHLLRYNNNALSTRLSFFSGVVQSVVDHCAGAICDLLLPSYEEGAEGKEGKEGKEEKSVASESVAGRASPLEPLAAVDRLIESLLFGVVLYVKHSSCRPFFFLIEKDLIPLFRKEITKDRFRSILLHLVTVFGLPGGAEILLVFDSGLKSWRAVADRTSLASSAAASTMWLVTPFCSKRDGRNEGMKESMNELPCDVPCVAYHA